MYLFHNVCCHILWIMALGILLRVPVGLVRSCSSWIFKVCFVLRSWRSWILGSWILNFRFIVGSWRSCILFCFVIAVGSWRSLTLNFCFVVRPWRSWILAKWFCRVTLEVLDLDILFRHRILWILDPDFWLRYMSGDDQPTYSLIPNWARPLRKSGLLFVTRQSFFLGHKSFVDIWGWVGNGSEPQNFMLVD